MRVSERAFTVERCPGGEHWGVVGLNGKFCCYRRSERAAHDEAEARRRRFEDALASRAE